ncbi:hypothetical protein WJX75_007354 [Coccomyxa subellipsoidea]|uniref:Serine/threonine-protein kinase BSK1-like TPR repeats domain-containing protein n=1 Tax=Coccomyxa subellipsoidea TaxID=248742 RepID=A0ABR2Z147_9CHLO
MTVDISDPTVASEDQLQEIEKFHGVSLRDTPTELLQFVVDQSKSAGNLAFRDHRYQEAVKLYSQAIAGAPKDASLFANRSAAYLMIGAKQEAHNDAAKTTKLKPDWPKGFFRLGMASLSMYEYGRAAAAFARGLRLDPSNKDLAARKATAEAHSKYEDACLQAQLGTHRRNLVLKLRAARRHELQDGMERQFKQSMTAPDWEMEDYDWRVLPCSSLRQWHSSSRRRFDHFTKILTLERPTFFPGSKLKRLNKARFMADPRARMLMGYVSALADLANPKAALPLLADERRLAAYEAAIVAALEEQPGAHILVLGAGSGVLALMAARAGAGRVTAVERSRMLYRMARQALDANLDAPGAANIRIVDCQLRGVGVQGESLPAEEQNALGSDVLGMGLLGALDYASAHLLKRGARVAPMFLRVRAMLVEMRITDVSGFDLSGLNRYRWNPSHEKIDLSRVPHTRLSNAFTAIDLDLQRRVDSLSGGGLEDGAILEILWESDRTLKVPATCSGRWNAVVFWFKGAKVLVRVRQDAGQLHFSAKRGAKRPRHAWVPRWHFDMVLDGQRNEAYQRAIRRAIDIKRGLGAKEVSVLDIGAGSGILSLMAARAGADRVTGAEIGQHMCDVAAEAVVLNGYAGKCIMINKDVRRMDAAAKPDGTPPDMEQKANVCIFEVFDSGLMGEGVLHLLAWAHARLLTPDCTLVPMAATVYCQPIQMRTQRVLGFDMAQANRWRWRPEYEGLDLGHIRSQWKALGPVTEVFAFDFYEAEANMQAAETTVRLTAHTHGTCNAIAFWFNLHLDEETELHTSPYTDKGPTWQQAVQCVEEVHLVPGQRFNLVAKHDTYGLSFALQTDKPAAESGMGRGSENAPPLWDPWWKATFEEVGKVNEKLSRAAVQNPLEYRATALAAVQIGSRPHDLGLDAEQAAAFCTRFMS